MMKEADAQARKVLENAREAAQKEHEMALAGARTEIGELAVQAAKKLLSGGGAGVFMTALSEGQERKNDGDGNELRQSSL